MNWYIVIFVDEYEEYEFFGSDDTFIVKEYVGFEVVQAENVFDAEEKAKELNKKLGHKYKIDITIKCGETKPEIAWKD
jgi:hypothetical protein